MQYGDAAVRRRWFFVCVVGVFCVVVAGWVAYLVWRGSLSAGLGQSAQNARSAWGDLISHLRDAVNK